MDDSKNIIITKVRDTLVKAGSTFLPDKTESYSKAIKSETNPLSKCVLQTILDNATVAAANKSPLCDDTGIPHLFLEVGKKRDVSGEMLEAIYEGIRQGLRLLPGRPMAVCGNDSQRLDQSGGLDSDAGALMPSPILIKLVDEDVIRLHILMLGGGPAIRGKTYRVFHKHNVETVMNEIVSWAKDAVPQLGCSPCTLAIGIGRSQFEAASLMMEAMVYGDYSVQSELEKFITEKVNESHIGSLGLGGDISVLATFMKIGHQRASGVRIVSFRPCCCFEPRKSSVEL